MKITNTTLGIICATFVLMVVSVAVLVGLGRDVGQLASFIGTTLVALPALFVAINKADKAEQNSADAKANSAEAVHNTNGRISELVSALHSHNVPIPPGYENVVPTLPASLIPDGVTPRNGAE